MILREIYLYPDLRQYPDDITGNVRDQTRCLCNYLERNTLKPLRYKTEGFKRICVVGSKESSGKVFVNSSGVACVDVKFSESEYQSNSGNLEEYFISLLSEGLSKIDEQLSIPLAEIYEGLRSFRDGGYENEWVYKTKTIKGTGLKASLHCKLTVEAFSLSLMVSKGKKLVCKKSVLNTPPDEIVFAPMFKDLVATDTDLRITDKFGDTIFEMPVAEVL
jgi:hypothetical protein